MQNIQVVPTGFANLLRWCKSSYNDPPIYITENGFSDLGTLEDYGRIKYFNVSIHFKRADLINAMRYLTT